MKESYDVIKSMLRTEKSNEYLAQNKYLFLVEKNSNKIDIKKAVEDIYKVKVAKVNTLVSRGKLKRVRYAVGRTTDKKKAIVTLKEGHKIDLT